MSLSICRRAAADHPCQWTLSDSMTCREASSTGMIQQAYLRLQRWNVQAADAGQGLGRAGSGGEQNNSDRVVGSQQVQHPR